MGVVVDSNVRGRFFIEQRQLSSLTNFRVIDTFVATGKLKLFFFHDFVVRWRCLPYNLVPVDRRCLLVVLRSTVPLGVMPGACWYALLVVIVGYVTSAGA